MSKAASGSGTIRKKTVVRNGKPYEFWEARVTVGTNPLTGKQQQKSFSGKTQAEVRQKMTQALAEIDNGEYFQPSTLTLAQWLNQWLEMLEGKVTFNTLKTYRSRVEQHIIPYFGTRIKLADVTKLQVQRFIDSLSKTLAPKTIRSIHGALGKALETAEEMELIKKNPCSKISLPRVEHKHVEALTDEQIKQMLKIAEERKYGHLLKFILLSGLRESEALGLRWDCVNFKDSTITIRRQLQKQGNQHITVEATKSHKARTIKLSATAMQILKDCQLKQIEDRANAGEAWEGWTDDVSRKTSLCFTNENGRYIDHESLYACVKRIARAMDLPNFTVHDLRHAFATLCLQNGDDLKTVSAALGHSTISVTADIYASVSEQMRTQSADRMEAFISRVS